MKAIFKGVLYLQVGSAPFKVDTVYGESYDDVAAELNGRMSQNPRYTGVIMTYILQSATMLKQEVTQITSI